MCTTPNNTKKTVKYGARKPERRNEELEAQKWTLAVPVIWKGRWTFFKLWIHMFINLSTWSCGRIMLLRNWYMVAFRQCKSCIWSCYPFLLLLPVSSDQTMTQLWKGLYICFLTSLLRLIIFIVLIFHLSLVFFY